MNPILKTVVPCMLLVGVMVSCNQKKSSNEAGSKKAQGNNEENTAVSNLTGMHLEEFNSQFIGILSQKSQMQSALTNKVDTLCVHLHPRLLENMLKLAATTPPDNVSEDNWLLGYNQLMAIAGKLLGSEATESFYNLAANRKASSVMRDYASQHYLRTESRLLLQATGVPENDLVHLQSVLEKAGALVTDAGEDADTLPGAILMGLAALSMQYEKQPEEFKMIQKKVRKLTIPILEHPKSYDDSTQISAIHAAARLRVEEAGPIIFTIALDKNAATIKRISAIASLRYFPDLVNIDIIKLQSERDKKIASATQSLIKELKKN